MKICFITYTIFNLGGVQRVLSVLASELSKKHEVTVLCMDNRYKEDRSIYNLDKSVNIHIWQEKSNRNVLEKIFYRSIKEINVSLGYFNNKKYLRLLTDAYFPKNLSVNLVELLNGQGFDIVVGVEGYYSLLLGINSTNIHAKTIGWQHNSFEAYLENKKRYYWNQDILFERYINELDDYIVLTEHDKKMFKEKKSINSHVIYNPRSFSNEKKSSVENKTFLAAGRFNYQKGFDLLIESFYEFSKYNDDWNLVIVGEGEEKNNILRNIEKYKLQDRIKVENFTSDIKSYFLKSSALLLSSRWEGMPMIVLEALEMGVPIISYDINAIKPLVTDKKEGIIVEKFNIKKFSKAMNEISSSLKIRKKLSENCISKSKEFDVQAITMQWDELFEKLIHKK